MHVYTLWAKTAYSTELLRLIQLSRGEDPFQAEESDRSFHNCDAAAAIFHYY
jgi:hypothetical protein